MPLTMTLIEDLKSKLESQGKKLESETKCKNGMLYTFTSPLTKKEALIRASDPNYKSEMVYYDESKEAAYWKISAADSNDELWIPVQKGFFERSWSFFVDNLRTPLGFAKLVSVFSFLGFPLAILALFFMQSELPQELTFYVAQDFLKNTSLLFIVFITVFIAFFCVAQLFALSVGISFIKEEKDLTGIEEFFSLCMPALLAGPGLFLLFFSYYYFCLAFYGALPLYIVLFFISAFFWFKAKPPNCFLVILFSFIVFILSTYSIATINNLSGSEGVSDKAQIVIFVMMLFAYCFGIFQARRGFVFEDVFEKGKMFLKRKKPATMVGCIVTFSFLIFIALNVYICFVIALHFLKVSHLGLYQEKIYAANLSVPHEIMEDLNYDKETRHINPWVWYRSEKFLFASKSKDSHVAYQFATDVKPYEYLGKKEINNEEKKEKIESPCFPKKKFSPPLESLSGAE